MKNNHFKLTALAVLAIGMFFLVPVIGNISGAKHYIPRLAEEDHSEHRIPAALWAHQLLVNPMTGEMDYDCIRQVQREVEGFRTFSPKSNSALSWTELGPDNIGGRTRAILPDRRDTSGKTLFAGGVAGGLFKSVNGGSTWTTIDMSNTGIAGGTLPVSCITQTVNGDIYVGTGEGHYNGRYQSNGTGAGGVVGYGVFKLPNGSSTWQQLASTMPGTEFSESSDWAYCNAITAHPTNNNILYASTNRGLWVTSDGNKFRRISLSSSIISQTGFSDDVEFCIDGSVIATVGSRLLKRVASATHDSTSQGFSRIDDVWYPTNIAKPSRIELAVSMSDVNVFYASCSNTSGGTYNIYRTTDGGSTYTVIGPGTPSASANASIALFRPFALPSAAPNQNTGQGDFDNIIAVHPTNPNVLYLGGTTNYKWTSTQGWSNISYYCTGGFGNNQCVHADMHGIAFHRTRPNIMYFTNDGGFYRSEDGGQTFTIRNSNYNVFQCYSVAFSKEGDAVISGSQDNGTILIPFNVPRSSPGYAFPINGGDGGYTEISIINTQAQFAATPNGDLRRSSNFGGSFNDYVSNGMKTQAADFVTPFELWESFNDPLSIDSVNVIASRVICLAGDFYTAANSGGDPTLIGTLIPGRDTMVAEAFTAITYNSKIRNLPVRGEMPFDVPRNGVFQMKDPVQSRMATAFGSRIFLTKEPLDFAKTPGWIPVAKNASSGTGNDNMSGSGKALAFSRDGDHLFFGTTSGQLYRISNISKLKARNDDDTLLMEVGRPQSPLVVKRIAVFPGSLAIMGIGVDPNNANNVVVTLANYASGQNHIYRTTSALTLQSSTSLNGFQSIQGSLPKFPVYDVVVDMLDNNRLVIGTEKGMWHCNDGFSSTNPTWVQDQTVPHIPVFMVRQNQYQRTLLDQNNDVLYNYVSASGTIYAATHGRGIWESKSYLSPGPLSVQDKKTNSFASELKVYPNPANQQLTLKAGFDSNTSITMEVYDVSGKLIKTSVYQPAVLQSGVLLDVSDFREGAYIVRMLSGSEAKTTRFVVSH